MKQRVLSGIRASGKLHLGNLLGAVKGMLELQDIAEYETLYMIADLHSMTTPYDPRELAKNTRDVALDYLASGLDPEKSKLFVQSDLADLHTQLAFLFSTVVSVARMQHLPTFKDKVKQHPEHVTMALLNYPVLMAADILIYRAGKVPVGIDQEPHLEIAREIARKLNGLYGTDFPEPTRFATKGEYVPSLTGEGKMSKSVAGSYISLSDDYEEIVEKLAKAPTDSGKADEVPDKGGIAYLLDLVELFEGKKKRKAYEHEYTDRGIKYQKLKAELAEAIFKELEPLQERRKELKDKKGYVDQVLKKGQEEARAIAEETVIQVREALGL